MKKALTILALVLVANFGFSQIHKHQITWQEIGEVKAGYGNDHDGINVNSSFNNFRIIKFKVSNADVNMERMEITYESGAKNQVPLKLVIRKGEESRDINLPGKERRIKRIDFWYNTKGMFSGKARVIVYGKH